MGRQPAKALYNEPMDALDMQRKGGKNSRKNVTKERASEIGRNAALARHGKKNPATHKREKPVKKAK